LRKQLACAKFELSLDLMFGAFKRYSQRT
jgi:hypothetical protein